MRFHRMVAATELIGDNLIIQAVTKALQDSQLGSGE
jgi:hypothetical protein